MSQTLKALEAENAELRRQLYTKNEQIEVLRTLALSILQGQRVPQAVVTSSHMRPNWREREEDEKG